MTHFHKTEIHGNSAIHKPPEDIFATSKEKQSSITSIVSLFLPSKTISVSRKKNLPKFPLPQRELHSSTVCQKSWISRHHFPPASPLELPVPSYLNVWSMCSKMSPGFSDLKDLPMIWALKNHTHHLPSFWDRIPIYRMCTFAATGALNAQEQTTLTWPIKVVRSEKATTFYKSCEGHRDDTPPP